MQSLRSRNTGRNRLKTALIAGLVLLLLAGVGVGSLYALKLGPFAQTNQAKNDSKDQTEDDDSTEPVNVDNPAPSDPSTDSVKTPSKASGSDDVSKSDDTLTITSAQVAGNTFSVRTLLAKVTQSGNCVLVMTSSEGKEFTASAGVQSGASSSTCKGFDVPLSSLGSGTWKVTVTYSNGSETSTATKEVVINA